LSRIAGLLSNTDEFHRSIFLKTMLETSHLNDGWSARFESLGEVTLGWTGWHAPNISRSNGVVVVMDGCIYNKADLGFAETDAAMLAALYKAYGFPEALRKVNGDFAAAVYDPKLNTLWLVRDRFGVKPLYYAPYADGLAFASQPGSLLRLPWVSNEVNRQFVALFAASHYRYIDNQPEASPYKNIAQLPAAHILRMRNNHLTTTDYWSIENVPDFEEPEHELTERYRDLLMDAVSIRVKAAHRPAFTLSGGMDSSSVLASAVRVTQKKRHAFSAVYTDKTYDESEEIQPMLDTNVESWTPVAVGEPDVFEIIQRMIRAHDEPVATATWLSHFLLCEEVAKQGFGSIFGGLGGDELNAGEYEYFLYHFADLRAGGCEAELRDEVDMWIRLHDHPIFRKSLDVVENGLSIQVDLNQPGRCLPDRGRLLRYATALNRDYFDMDGFEPVMDHPFGSYLKNRTYQDIFRETAPCSLRAEDRGTTAFGLDHLLPFFDHRLVEFMFRVPGKYKIRDGVTKRLLRKATHGILPEETRTRVKKTGWNAPAHVWFSGTGRESLLDMVRSSAFRERGIYNVAEVERLIDEHHSIVSSGRPLENHMMFLWQLVNLELWLSSLDS
jgi:asparagine synthase (glutamine-hydrolysing)